MAQQAAVEIQPTRLDREYVISLPKTRSRSVTRTVRLDNDIEEGLIEHAGRERVSANVVVNQALRHYLRWEVLSERFGFMAVASSTMYELFDGMTEDEARKRGREEGCGKAAEFVTFFFKKFDLDATLRALEMLGPMYGKNFQFERSFDGRTLNLILRHHRGPKTSAYYSEALKSIFNRLGLKSEVSETDDQVALTTQLPTWLRNPYEQA